MHKLSRHAGEGMPPSTASATSGREGKVRQAGEIWSFIGAKYVKTMKALVYGAGDRWTSNVPSIASFDTAIPQPICPRSAGKFPDRLQRAIRPNMENRRGTIFAKLTTRYVKYVVNVPRRTIIGQKRQTGPSA